MYIQILRKILAAHLSKQSFPTIDELWVRNDPILATKNLAFVTLYKNGEVIASSGRIHNVKKSTLQELIENGIIALGDPRAQGQITPENLSQIHIRIDIIPPEMKRTLRSYTELQRKEGIILFSQSQNFISVVLPHIAWPDRTPMELFQIACKKVWFAPTSSLEWVVILWIESQLETDF
jgi:AMMECR1